jgi:hypothetical protein
VRGELPAHDLAAERVNDKREEHQPVPATQIRQISDPQLVRPRCREIALHKVRTTVGKRIRPRRAPRPPAPLRTHDPVLAHQTLHPAARHTLAGAQQRLPHPPVAISEVVALVRCPDQLEQPLVLDGAS